MSNLNLIKWRDELGKVQRFRLIEMIARKWRTFGSLLALELAVLDNWEAQYAGDSTRCCNRVMEYWLNGDDDNEYPPTWEGLYELLEDAEFLVAAKQLKVVVSHLEEQPISKPDPEQGRKY